MTKSHVSVAWLMYENGEEKLGTARDAIRLLDAGVPVTCRCAGHGVNGEKCEALLTPVRQYRKRNGTSVEAYFTVSRRRNSHVKGCPRSSKKTVSDKNLAAQRRKFFSLKDLLQRLTSTGRRKYFFPGNIAPGLGLPRKLNTAYNKHLNGFFGDEDELGEVFKDGFSSWESFLSEKTVGFYLLNPEKLGGRVMIVKLRLCKRPLVRKIITELIGGDWILEASVVDRSHRLQLYFSLVISEKAKRDVMHTILTNRDCNYLVIADWKPAKLIAGKFFVVQGIITSHKQIEVM